MIRLRCYVCNVNIYDPYYVRHLRSRKHLRSVGRIREGGENELYNVLRLRQIVNREI